MTLLKIKIFYLYHNKKIWLIVAKHKLYKTIKKVIKYF